MPSVARQASSSAAGAAVATALAGGGRSYDRESIHLFQVDGAGRLRHGPVPAASN